MKSIQSYWECCFGARRRKYDEWTEGKNTRRLVVLLHAYGASPGALNQIADEVHNRFPDADLFRPVLPFRTFSTSKFSVIAKDIVDAISRRCAMRQYPEILLIGHSLGALLARKVYVVACGETRKAPFEDVLLPAPVLPWAKNVERILLFAAMNRGWRISHHLSMSKALGLSAAVLLGRLIEFGTRKPLLIMQLRRGAPALTQLRLQWLAMRQAVYDRNCGGALTVQLLGSIDDIVSPEDNVDLISGEDFVYLDVPASGHIDVVYVKGQPGLEKLKTERDRAAQRYQVFMNALTLDNAKLKQIGAQLAETPFGRDEAVTDVIFVVHGIRDEGFWTQRIARRVKALGQNGGARGRKFAMVTSSYGYFPMAPFLIAARRREKVEWLMDQYAQAVARYPNAQAHFSCVAHSNGTYLVAKALQDYSAVQFERIVFAGSVARRAFPWGELSDRAKSALNYVATADWVVACFPKLFEFLPVQDIGSAGHDGFITTAAKLSQIRYVCGGHSAALKEEHWDEIAEFIVNGKMPVPNVDKQVPIVKLLGHFAPLVWLGLLLTLCLIGWTLWRVIPGPELRTVVCVVYVLVIWKLLNWL